MRRFSGAGGILFALGERLTFPLTPLEDCGDGWDWRAPTRISYWLEPPTVIAIQAGESEEVKPAELYLQFGRVGLPRNMSHGLVFASGVCRPTSLLGESESWELHVEASVDDTPGVPSPVRVTGTTGILHGVQVPITTVLARLPSGDGMFIGIGEAHPEGPNTVIEFDQEGVQYGIG